MAAGQVPGGGVLAQTGGGLGPVGLEEGLLQALELPGHDGPGDGVEGDLAQPHPPEAPGQVDVTALPAVLVGGLGAVRVGPLLPVLQDRHEVPVAQLGRLGHEHLLVAVHGLSRLRRAGPHEQVDLGRRHRARGKGLRPVGQVAQPPAPAHHGLGPTRPLMTPGGHPGRRAPGPVEGPAPRGVEGGGGLAHHRFQTAQLPVEDLDGLGVGPRRRVRLTQLVDRFLEDHEIHEGMEPYGCNGEPVEHLETA